MRRTRARRVVRALAGWLGAVLAVVLVTSLAGRGEASEHPDEQDVRRGQQLYARNCAACHGMTGEGTRGSGPTAGPPIDDVDVALVDLLIRTGRMPIVAREAGITPDPELDDRDRAGIVAWMAGAFELEGGVPDVPAGDAGRGRLLFNQYCAACHSSTGWGGVAGDDVVPPSLRGLDRVALFSAARVGPFEMPVFPEAVVTDEELADIATAVEEMERERPSSVAFIDLNHVSGTLYSLAAVALLLGLVVVVSRLPGIVVAAEEEFELEHPDGPEEGEESP